MPIPREVHEAMMNAPHDGEPYRQARAAIAAIEGLRVPPPQTSAVSVVPCCWNCSGFMHDGSGNFHTTCPEHGTQPADAVFGYVAP